MRKTVIWVLILLIAALAVFDIVLATNRVKGDTISAITFEAAHRLSMLPFALGVLMGHLLWPSQKQRTRLQVWGPLGTLLVLTVFADTFAAPYPAWVLPLIFALGFGCGAFLWPNLGNRGE